MTISSSCSAAAAFGLLIFSCTPQDASGTKLMFRDCNGSIRHVHLAVGADPSTSMTVSFASIFYDNSTSIRGGVLIGRSPNSMDRLVVEEEEPIYYAGLQPPRLGRMYYSPYQHHVTITDLKPRTTYYYRAVTRPSLDELLALKDALQNDPEALAIRVNEEERERENSQSNASFKDRKLSTRVHEEMELLRHRRLAPPPYDSSQCACPDPDKIRSFRTPARPGHGYPKIAVVGDIGQFAHSEETWDHLRTHHGDDIDSIILAGDLAYPELDHRRWDTFMDFLDDYPLVDQVPMHITPGNHDIGKPEAGYEIFQAYETRFRMPRIQAADLGLCKEDGKMSMDRPPYPLDYDYGNAYYAFKYGRTHQIYLSSYSAMEPGSKQFDWLVEELEERVDRQQTPWLIVTFHVPIYNTFEVHQKDEQMLKMREHIEPLLVHHRVNVVFNGHIHAYLRTHPVAFGTVDPRGPIYIVMGAGGRNADAAFLHEEPEEWVVQRDATIYGYGLLEIFNQTHARWDWVHTGVQEGSYNHAYNLENVTLPPGGVDHVIFQNQWFL